MVSTTTFDVSDIVSDQTDDIIIKEGSVANYCNRMVKLELAVLSNDNYIQSFYFYLYFEVDYYRYVNYLTKTLKYHLKKVDYLTRD